MSLVIIVQEILIWDQINVCELPKKNDCNKLVFKFVLHLQYLMVVTLMYNNMRATHICFKLI